MSTFANAGFFLIELVFDIYIIMLMLRLILQKVGASYHNPISQLVIRLTNALVVPLQRIIPGFKGFDFAIILLVLIFEIIEMILLMWLRYKVVPGFGGTVIVAIGMIGRKLMNLYFWAIIIWALTSWVVSLQRSPVAEIVYLITEPVMRRARRIIPTIAGFDLTPIPVLILLQLASMVVFNPIIQAGMRVALS